MILDNVDDPEIIFGCSNAVTQDANSSSLAASNRKLAEFIPRYSHGVTLATTRNKQAALKLASGRSVLHVGPLDHAESCQLIRKRLDDECVDNEQTYVLANDLRNLPLALAQAAAFMRQNSLTVEKYIQLLRRSDHDLVDLLSQPFEDESRDSSVPNAVAATWILSFKQIQRHHSFAGQLLSLMSFFDWQDIPKLFLASYQEHGADSDANQMQEELRVPKGAVELEKALGVIKAFSFISEGEAEDSFDMHRLTQLVMRKWLIVEAKAGRWHSLALDLLSTIFPYGQYEHWTECTRYLPHVLCVLTQGCDSEKDTTAKATLQHKVALFMLYQGKWDDAEAFQLPATEIRKRVLGAEHPDMLTSMANLASTFWNQGRWKEAEELGVQVMEMRKRVLGAEHPDTLTGMANLASTFWNQGRWKEAEELEVQVMETSLRVLGAEHPSTLTSMANLASTYWNQGRWKEAEELDVQVMETSLRVLGAEHPDTLTSIANLASTFWNQGRWKEAEELEVQVMEMRKRVLGAEHPDTLTGMANLASTFWNQGRWKEAEELEVQVMETRKRVLGAEHPSTLTSIANLASTFWNQGRWKEAEELEVQVMETSLRVLGAEHPSTLTGMANLASTYWNQGRWKEANELQAKEWDLCKRVLGPEHPDTLTSMANVAHIWKGQDREKEAVALMKECVQLRERVLGPEHPFTSSSRGVLIEWEMKDLELEPSTV
jgi:hypothetical protein